MRIHLHGYDLQRRTNLYIKCGIHLRMILSRFLFWELGFECLMTNGGNDHGNNPEASALESDRVDLDRRVCKELLLRWRCPGERREQIY